MPSAATVEAFMAVVESGDYVGAIGRYYAADASMRENQDEPRQGRQRLMEDEAQAMRRVEKIIARRMGPPLIAGDQVAIRWQFDFHHKDGSTGRLDEIAWQTWRGEEVVEETFFYDPRQMGR
ncbi:MAG TPA: nuclear transport factor 2 family protein, partial [Phenylobacterium sp.]|nr:nuclear transport factor 2 family protein [Phenylobacterium sp.]